MYDTCIIFIFDSENENNVVRCFDLSPEDSKKHMTLFGKIKTFLGVPLYMDMRIKQSVL